MQFLKALAINGEKLFVESAIFTLSVNEMNFQNPVSGIAMNVQISHWLNILFLEAKLSPQAIHQEVYIVVGLLFSIFVYS